MAPRRARGGRLRPTTPTSWPTRSRRAGSTLERGQTGLDFGCSSGRVVRVLAAAYPELDWHGCDPIPDAIEWARAQPRPAIALRAAARRPRRSRTPTRRFDFVFAISIWSHFAEGAALAWLREMRRMISARAGASLLTTHGDQTIAHTHREGVRSRGAARARCARRSYERGFWYAAEFGEAGDHGVANPDWGTAFLSPEWLLAKRHARVAGRPASAPGASRANQDLYVLERELGRCRAVSVVIPVKDGGPLLGGVLGAVRSQGELELLVIDSGSADGSQELARAAGGELIEIAPAEFGHGRTRNLGAERAVGRADLLPDPGRRARARLARRATSRRSSSTRGSARLRPAPAVRRTRAR